jgi:iron complex outermembrane receptor protein
MKLKSSIVAAACISSTLIAAPAVKLDTLSVTASTIDERFDSIKHEVSNVSTISGEQVDNAHAENIQQVLQSIPGITTEVQGGDSLKIHIRGVENQRFMGEKPGVAVVIDGVPVFERTGKVNIDLDNIESIKVVKGGASYLFGDDALSGAVIITTKRGAKYDKNYAAFEMGSFDYTKFVGRTGVSTDNYSGHIQVSQRKGDGYWEDADYLTQYVNGKFQYYIDDTSDITIGGELSHREKDSHGTVTGMTQALSNPKSQDDGSGDGRDYVRKFDVDLAKLFVTYSKDIEDDNLMVNVYQFTDHTKYLSAPQKYDLANNKITDNDAYSQTNDYKQTQRGLKGEYRLTRSKLAGMVGVDLRDNSYENFTKYILSGQPYPFAPAYADYFAGSTKYDNITEENVYALYAEAKYALTDKLVMTANFRHDTMEYDYTELADPANPISLDTSFYVQSYRIGATYALQDDLTLYTNVSTGFRTPTVQQMFSGEIGVYGDPANSNPNLEPEKATNYEIGLRGANQYFNYDAAVFQIDRDDFILSTAGQYVNPNDTNVTTAMYDNVGGVRNRGLELALDTQPINNMWFNVAYTYLDTEFTAYHDFYLYLNDPDFGGPLTDQTIHYDLTGNEVPRVSKHQLNLMFNYKPMNELTTTLELNVRSSYYADETNFFKMPGYEVVNFLASYHKKIGDYYVNAFARIDNLLGEDYFNTARGMGDNNDDGVYDQEDLSIVVNPGRVFTAGLSIKF